MLKQHKWKILISSLVILLPILAGVLLWDQIPKTFGSKPLWVFGMPGSLLAIHWLCLFFTSFDNTQQNQNPKAFRVIFFCVPAISIAASGLMYSIALGRDYNPLAIMFIVMSLLFLFIGNYMPKVKRNRTLGIRISWTLNNEENWQKTHRFSGKIWVIGGFIQLFSVLLPETAMMAVFFCVLIVNVIAPFVYSYRIYKAHRKAGISYEAPPKTKAEKVTMRISLAVVALILVGCVVLTFTGEVAVACDDNALRIEATYWQDLELPYGEIDSVEYREDLSAGTRINGFASGRLLLGIFRSDALGTYTRYTYADSDACIVLTADGEKLVISGKTGAETQNIYRQLLEKTQ